MSDSDVVKLWSDFWKSGSALAASQPAFFKEIMGRLSPAAAPSPGVQGWTGQGWMGMPAMPGMPPSNGMPFPGMFPFPGAANAQQQPSPFPWMPMPFAWPPAGPSETPSPADNQHFKAAVEAWNLLPFKLGFPTNSWTGPDTDTVTAQILKKIFDPGEWLSVTGFMDPAVQRLTEGPKFADIGHMERMYARLSKAWSELVAVNLRHQSNVLKAWTTAIGEFVATLNKGAAKGTPMTSRTDIVALWVEIGNRHLNEAQSSEPYLKTQRELLKASLDFRLAQQAITNFYAEMMGAPTRPEIDDLARMVADLRREMRSYRRAQRQAVADQD